MQVNLLRLSQAEMLCNFLWGPRLGKLEDFEAMDVGLPRDLFRSSNYLPLQGSFVGRHFNFCKWDDFATTGKLLIKRLALDPSKIGKV